ncbi:chemotaxis protein CheA [bacterium]|nr:chemotaxis protein CheA [bacterium]MBU1994190.1 chemotaxis protein CheA [bacterium]
MSEELEYFNEDAQEQLQMMESALLDAMEKGVNSEYIGTIFRAMHTIKGVAGMFSFEDIISFTHIAENLMDAVRNGKIALNEDLLMLLLECKDHVGELVHCAVESIAIPQNTLEKDKLLKLTIKEYLESPADKPKALQKPEEEVSNSNLWHISLYLKEHFFETGMDLLSILAYLQRLGTLHSISPVLDKLPGLELIDPHKPYLGFEIEFEGEITKEEIVEVFEFVEDDITLDVFSATKAQDMEAEEIKPQEQEPPIQIKPTEIQTIQAKKESLVKQAGNVSQSLRVDSSKIDTLIDTISEMVIANARINRYVEKYADADLEEVCIELGTLLEELRNNVMNIRMVAVGESFEKFRRVVNDVARKLNKKINFTIQGGDTELDKTVIEKIADPLLHMLRNSVDHGIETTQERLEKGKSEYGNVELRAYPESGAIVIEIEDDGKGLALDAIISKARAKGIIDESEELSDAEAYKLIFEPGFSTAAVISDISGRGVGMDVVKKNIEALKGEIELQSKVGKGSCFTIRLPLTLAIIEGFLFQVGHTNYIIPLDMVSEVIEFTAKHRVNMRENNLFDLRGTLLPLLDIRNYYNELPCKMCERQNIIVVKYGRNKMGLLVDELFGEYQTVIKPLGRLFQNAPGLYGASILGSGEIALIFDIPALFEMLKIN